ncbi:MAG TPA: farnesyl diphosphate synthase [Gammaproteobacteria bacterium]|nr:farnesyl diphosphate synthase [Gammaproteobacteria bacterium]
MKLLHANPIDENFEAYRKTCIARIELFLTHLLPKENVFPLFEAMRYAVLNGGKRLRPLFVYATGEALGSSLDHLDAPAAAIELVHCYSLIHDDLPAMDNDDLRRGKPTCHKVFGEATAILAGDALLTLAFKILSDPKLNPIPAEQQIQMIQILSEKSGMRGMIEGQSLDLASEGKHQTISFENLCQIHNKKTSSLIEAAVTLGAIASLGFGSMETHKNIQAIILKLQEYARCIGLAFQIQDDILDMTSDTKTLGKSIGKDQQQNKATFPSRLGLEQAKQQANALHQQALQAITFLDAKSLYLKNISDLLINRKY